MILAEWLDKTAWDKHYWNAVAIEAKKLKSDGCTGVLDLFVWTCWEHDIHYRTHKFLDSGEALTKETADYVLRVRIQQTRIEWRHPLKMLCDPIRLLKYPISWIRWYGIAVLGKKISEHAWHDADSGTTAFC